MINNPIIFYIASFILIGFALMSMLFKNIIYSLLCAIMVFFSASIFFYILGSEYNAIIQAAIYGLAVPIIIGLSIMFTTRKNKPYKESLLSYITIISSILFIMALIYVIMISLVMTPDSFRFMELVQFNSYDVISEFARGIFIDYVWAFELVSLLLTIIIAGFTLFSGRLKVESGKLKKNKENRTNV